jgi:hypothetical protein
VGYLFPKAACPRFTLLKVTKNTRQIMETTSCFVRL